MKKTLIALLALSSAAFATSLSDAVLDTQSKSLTIDDTSALYSATATSYIVQLDLNALKKAISSACNNHISSDLISVSIADAEGTDLIGAGLLFTSSQQTPTTASIWTHLEANEQGVITGRTNLLANNNPNMLSQIDLSDYTGAALALTQGATTGTTITLTLEKADGTTTVYTNTDTGLKHGGQSGVKTITVSNDIVQRTFAFNSQVSTGDIQTMSAIVAPEPATATLSLLALAGLAARRRRH